MSAPRPPLLRWVRAGSRAWVDENACYSLRLRLPGGEREPFYESWTIYPGCQSRLLGTRYTLDGAQRLAQADFDGALGEAAA